jgi:hypothetical protein
MPPRWLGFVYVCLAFAQSQPPVPGPTKAGQNKQSRTNHKDTKATDNKDIPAVAPAIVNAPIYEDTAKREQEPTSPDRWIRILTGVIAVSTVAQAYIYWRQKKVMEDGLEVADRSARAALSSADAAKRSMDVLLDGERAWIVVSLVSPPGLMLRVLRAPGGFHRFVFNIKNVGKTVARIVGYKYTWRILPNGEALPPVPEYGTIPGEEADVTSGRIMSPEQVIGGITIVVGEAFDADSFNRLQAGEIRLWIYAYIDYVDLADREHRTQFCYRYRPPLESVERKPRFIVDGPRSYNKNT